ncbi:helix-turn-helix domain-containing protein, partial [Rhodococcus aetherivorans]|uniref:helix-turn-helix domain-containing protein n=1 Tax=Rhodococcus aetherivorans TaxID=191292 RepID=UPI000677E6B7
MTTAEKAQDARKPHDNLPLRLVMLRHECGVSQRQAAARIGVTPRVWQGMEEGRNTAGLLEILQKVSDEFGYDLHWLTWGGPLEQKTPRHLGRGDGGLRGITAE